MQAFAAMPIFEKMQARIQDIFNHDFMNMQQKTPKQGENTGINEPWRVSKNGNIKTKIIALGMT